MIVGESSVDQITFQSIISFYVSLEMALPTPYIAHLTTSDYELVYEPAGKSLTLSRCGPSEDSFILLDALEIDAEYLRSKKPSVCVEIGYVIRTLQLLISRSGSGIISTFLANLLGHTESRKFPFDPFAQVPVIISTDINCNACLATNRTAIANDVSTRKRSMLSDHFLDLAEPGSVSPARTFIPSSTRSGRRASLQSPLRADR